MVGSVVLLMFIYGGATWILSAGNSERVQKGKQIIFGAIIGLLIVFGSYTIVYYTLEYMGVTEGGSFRSVDQELEGFGEDDNQTPPATP